MQFFAPTIAAIRATMSLEMLTEGPAERLTGPELCPRPPGRPGPGVPGGRNRPFRPAK
jgi:hypothetical protein